MPTVYALHALATTPEIWQDVRDAAPDLTFVTPDLLRLLENARADQTLERLLVDLIDQAPAGPLLLAGASIGANIALELGALLGDRVVGTLLIVPGPPALDAAFRDRSHALLRSMHHAWTDEMVANFAKLLVYPFGPRHASVAARVERMLRHNASRSAPLLALSAAFRDAQDLLPHIRGPVRALLGADNANPLTGSVLGAWRDLLGDAAVERVESASESLVMERPDAVVGALRSMIQEAAGSY